MMFYVLCNLMFQLKQAILKEFKATLGNMGIDDRGQFDLQWNGNILESYMTLDELGMNRDTTHPRDGDPVIVLERIIRSI